jgi:hypothetical protein
MKVKSQKMLPTMTMAMVVGGCGTVNSKSSGGTPADQTGDQGSTSDEQEDFDSGGGQGDSGGEGRPPLPISLRIECPEDGMHFSVPTEDEFLEYAPASFYITPEDVDYTGSDPVFAKIEVTESTLPWAPPLTAQDRDWTEVVEGGDILMFQSDFVGTFTIAVSLRAGASATQTPWTCEMQWHNFNRFWVELQSAPGVTSDVQLHGLINQETVDETDIYSPDDVTWCNRRWDGPDPDASTDDVHYGVVTDRIGASIAVLYSPAVVDTSVDLVGTAESVTQWEDESERLRPESEVRIYSFDSLLHTERVRFENDATYHFGRIVAGADRLTSSSFAPVQAAMRSSDLWMCQD